MRTIGSLTLCRSLLHAGLVDRFRVVVFPVITGRTGRERIYDGYPDIALDMMAAAPSTGASSCSNTCRGFCQVRRTMGNRPSIPADALSLTAPE